jgi:hypothetical protein
MHPADFHSEADGRFLPFREKKETRRTFLKALSASSLAALMVNEPRLLGATAPGSKLVHPTAKADC